MALSSSAWNCDTLGELLPPKGADEAPEAAGAADSRRLLARNWLLTDKAMMASTISSDP